MDTIFNRVKLVFQEHKTEMLIAAGLGFALGAFLF